MSALSDQIRARLDNDHGCARHHHHRRPPVTRCPECRCDPVLCETDDTGDHCEVSGCPTCVNGCPLEDCPVCALPASGTGETTPALSTTTESEATE